MGWLDNLFSSKKQETTQSTQTGQAKTQSNIWDQIQPYFTNYLDTFANFSGGQGSAPINQYQTGSADQQMDIAPGLAGAAGVAGNIAQSGLTTADIQRYMNPYISNVVDPTLAAQEIQNKQATSDIRGKMGVQGALGNNVGNIAAYYAGVQPAQQAEIAKLYSQGFDTAGQLATQDINAKLAGVQGQGQIAGAQTGANTAGYNMGQGIWDSTFKNNFAPLEYASNALSGLTAFGNLAGTNTQSSGTATGTGTTTGTPSKAGIFAGLLGTGLSAFAEGGAVEGEGSPLPLSIDKDQNGIPDSLEAKVTRYAALFDGLRKKANGGAVEAESAIEPYAGGGDVGLGSWSPVVTREPMAPAGPSKLQKFGSGLSDLSKGMDEDMGGSSLGAQQQALGTFLSGLGRPTGGRVPGVVVDEDEPQQVAMLKPYMDQGSEYVAPEQDGFVDPDVDGAGYGAAPGYAETPPLPVYAEPPPATGTQSGSWMPFSSGVWAGQEMTPMQRLGFALTQVGDSPFKGVGQFGLEANEARLKDLSERRAASAHAEAIRHNKAMEGVKATKKTALEQQLEAAGYIPGTKEYQDAVKNYLSKAQTQIDMRQESKFDGKMGELLADDFIKTQQAAGESSQALANLKLLQGAIADPNVYSGTGGTTVQALKKGAQSLFGVPVKGVGSGELIQSLGTELALNNREKLPGPMSNADREFLVEMGPSLAKTPEGNRLIIEVGMASKRWQLAKAEAQREYMRTHEGRLDSGIYEVLGDLDRASEEEFGQLFARLKTLGEAAPRAPTVGTGLSADPLGLNQELGRDLGAAP